MSNLITPNRLESQEIQQLIANKPNLDIPTKIPAYNSNAFVLLGVTTLVDDRGIVSDLMKVFTKTKDNWIRLKPYDKQPKVLCNCQQVYILHNPTLKAAPKANTPIEFVPFVGTGRLTDTKKAKIDAMLEDGKGQDDNGLNAIAKDLNVSFDKIKEYIQSF